MHEDDTLIDLFESGFAGNIVDIRDTVAGESIRDEDLAIYASMIEAVFLTRRLNVRVVDHPDRYSYPVVQYDEDGTISYFAVGPGGIRVVEPVMKEILSDIDISPVGGRLGEPQVAYIVQHGASYFQLSFTPRPQTSASPLDYFDLDFE